MILCIRVWGIISTIGRPIKSCSCIPSISCATRFAIKMTPALSTAKIPFDAAFIIAENCCLTSWSSFSSLFSFMSVQPFRVPRATTSGHSQPIEETPARETSSPDNRCPGSPHGADAHSPVKSDIFSSGPQSGRPQLPDGSAPDVPC